MSFTEKNTPQHLPFFIMFWWDLMMKIQAPRKSHWATIGWAFNIFESRGTCRNTYSTYSVYQGPSDVRRWYSQCPWTPSWRFPTPSDSHPPHRLSPTSPASRRMQLVKLKCLRGLLRCLEVRIKRNGMSHVNVIDVARREAITIFMSWLCYIVPLVQWLVQWVAFLRTWAWSRVCM